MFTDDLAPQNVFSTLQVARADFAGSGLKKQEKEEEEEELLCGTSKENEEVGEYRVCVLKRLGDVLGISVLLASGSSCGAVVKGIHKDGLIRKWNDSNPGRSVQVGDKVVSVNGVRGASSAILADMLLSEVSLDITFLRCDPDVHDL
eukprot:CAMPEP_0194490724 /NCGR_PEP_ID=MMETSP0253-20130528/9842_1 /TAXON_ID=2966 /ORGANISM="Noctiluca scintillans" /LENGTH=146 /DNA_ID=CAMNT_0039331383 /DNA_START=123 /DNA_END=563 /DNA_ORIENTATION=-